jgi:Amiloride-sensitive sodium channel
MTSERRELYGRTDFLANCGGLLGLFLGISVFSFVEFVFYFTARLWCYLKKPNETISDHIETSDPRNDRTNRYLKVVTDLMADYSSKTTIQGVNYVADTALSLAERIWWAIVIILSALCCGSLILDVVRQYDQSPIIVSYANEETPVSQVKEVIIEMKVWVLDHFTEKSSPKLFDRTPFHRKFG